MVFGTRLLTWGVYRLFGIQTPNSGALDRSAPAKGPPNQVRAAPVTVAAVDASEAVAAQDLHRVSHGII